MKLKSRITQCEKSCRVYLMELHPGDFPDIINHLDILSHERHYSKIFAKVPARYGPGFLNAGYIMEASIPEFYSGKDDVLFLMKYLDDERRQPESQALAEFQAMLLYPPENKNAPIDPGFNLHHLGIEDAGSMAALFAGVFESYPFPIFDPSYLIRSMTEDGTRYFGASYDRRLIAVSSAECSASGRNAEMTDFAVMPSHRGKRLARHLLAFMENELVNEGYLTLYTIARLHSLPMNKTFYNLGYKYSGTLIKNTQISGQIESMNVWYKRVGALVSKR